MIKYSDIKIPGQKEEDLKGQTNQLLAASQLKNTIGSMDAEFKAFSALLDNSMRNTSSFNQQQEESYKLIAEEAAANRFSQQFKPERVDEEMEALAKEAGYESRGKIFFGKDDTINTGYMGHAAAIDAGNMFSGNFELISTNQAALRTKTQMMGSNSLLSKSKAWNAIKGQFNLSGPDKDYYKYHTTTDNNWERLTNINSLESLAMAVPIVDPLFNILADQTPEEKLLGRKEPGFDGGAIVSAIAKDDPDFLAFLNYQGVDLKALKEAANPFHFRWIMNSTIQANAISSSTAASEAYHSPITNWTLFGVDQLKGSLTSGDFVSQIVLTAATAGLGSVVAGTATVINATTASSRVEGAVTASKTAIKIAQAGKTIREMKNWLPVNLPTTLMRKAAPTGLSFGKGGVASFGAWVTGQSIEGFLEEGLTDIFNQAYEKNEGFRIKYNYEQMWKAALMGAAMEPILGGAIGVATIPINLTVSTVGSVGLDVGGKLFSYSVGIKPIRVREMNLYFEEFMGKFESLSPEEQQIRIGMVTSGLVTEAALNEATGGTFGQIDSPENQLLLGRVLSLIDGGERTNPGQGREFLSNLAVRLQGIRQQLVGANNKTSLVAVEDKQFIEFSSGEDQSKINNTRILYTDGVDKVLTVKDGNLTFTKDGAELLMFAMIVNAQSSSETASDNIVEMMSFLGRDRLQEVVKKNNPHLNKETLSEDETRELTDKVLEIITTEGETEFTKIMEEINSSFEVLQHIDLDLQADGVNTVMIQVDPEVAKRIIESKKITRAQIQKIINETPAVQAAPEATPVAPEATPVAPEATPKAPEATPKAPEATPKAPEAIPTIAPTAAATTNLTLNDAEIKTRLESLPPELLNALNNLPSC